MSGPASISRSSSVTLGSSEVFSEKDSQSIYGNPRVQASEIVEYISSQSGNSSTVYIFDLAEQVGFGTLTKEWAKSDGKETAPVVPLQTRAGAGLSLVGRLSEGTSQEALNGAVLTAYASLTALSMMAPALAYLPPATSSSRLIIQVPVLTPTGENLSLVPSYAALANSLPILPRDVVVLASATPQESVDFAQLSYKLTSSHVIHLFDQHSAAREVGHALVPFAADKINGAQLSEVVQSAGYGFFSYTGDANAETVLIALNGPLALYAKSFTQEAPGFGVVTVSVLRPWDEEALRSVLPKSVKTTYVLDEVPNMTTQGPLYIDVFGTLIESPDAISVKAHRITPTETQTFLFQKDVFRKLLASFAPTRPESSPDVIPDATKKLLLFSTPKSALAVLPRVIEDVFSSQRGISARLLVDHDVFSKQGGISASRILLSPKSKLGHIVPISLVLPFDTAAGGEVDFLAVLDHSLLKSHSVLDFAKPGSVVLVVTSWSPAELFSNLSSSVVALIKKRALHVYTIDAKAVASDRVGVDGSLNDSVQNLVAHMAFLRLYLGSAAQENLVLKAARGVWDGAVAGVDLEKLNSHVWSALVEIEIPDTVPETNDSTPLKKFDFNAVAVETDDGETVVNGARLGSWHDAAKHILFPDAFTPEVDAADEEFPQNPALRPEVPDRTYLVTCTVNRRLTPKEYDRNVFHLEFDTSDTGLKYSIGEALGIHGWNDEQEVLDFCAWYGVDSNRLITIPVPNGDGKMHTRTVFQALQQQIDLFGRPTKSFYTDLAPYAKTSVDRHALLFIGSPEGSATFKKLAEKDTVTFAEVLQLYPSAKPGIETLCELIGDIKPRHYSIASAQSVVGNRVDLLVVTVDWVTPSGSPRFGQCTRYLAGLKIGQKVTVSIKPSVMKLPPDNKQPLIMAGLGTGAAPFRAFLQHRAMLREKGVDVGPVYYYFGSRHQSQEYLYGEEIEAFIQDGIITRAGLAFSRDGPNKVYIQHKMLEDSEALAEMLQDGNGVFYLCGPTWPVPDVYEALVNALVKYKGQDPIAAGEYLESLKEEERYVLEVY